MSGLRLASYLALQRAIGSRVDRAYADFLRVERLSRSTFERERQERLGVLLKKAVDRIPFYRSRVSSGSHPSLTDFPILTKRDLFSSHAHIRDPDLRAPRGYDWIEVKTGGSTGEPTTVIHDGAFRDAGRASRLYSQTLCGFPFGTPYHRLWGSMADLRQMQDGLAARVTRRLARETLHNGFRLDASACGRFLDTLQRDRARHVMAYVDALDEVARFAESRDRCHPLVSIMTCAGTLTTEIRDRLTRVFGARVHNKYGSRECTDMACMCERGSLHVYAHHIHLEIVDEAGKPCPPGVAGRVLVTLLGNERFPLIRYEIGDRAAWSAQDACPCGRPFPVLDRLEGREVEFLRAVDGAYVSPVFIRHLIGVVHNPGVIRRFQLVQEPGALFVLTVEPFRERAGLDAARRAILDELAGVLGRSARIDWREVAEIPPTASGKFLYCINRDQTAR